MKRPVYLRVTGRLKLPSASSIVVTGLHLRPAWKDKEMTVE
jgi:hypothetical protein